MSEFFSDWHKERQLEDLQREVDGWRRRQAELADRPDASVALEEAKQGEQNALAELDRLKAQTHHKKKGGKR